MQSVYSTKYNKDYWEVPVTQLKTVAEVSGKLVKYIRIETVGVKPTVLQFEVYGKE